MIRVRLVYVLRARLRVVAAIKYNPTVNARVVEFGRHARLRIWSPKGVAGSNPASGTMGIYPPRSC